MLLRCTACHGTGSKEGGLDLSSREAMLRGGKSGPALVPGKPDQSLIIQKLRSGEMPPKKGLNDVEFWPITSPEVEKVVRRIAQGTLEGKSAEVEQAGPEPLVSDKDRQFWAFQSPRPAAHSERYTFRTCPEPNRRFRPQQTGRKGSVLFSRS